MHPSTIYILLIIFVATLVRSTFGFGESLLGVPLLLFYLPIETAVPLCVLISTFIAAILLLKDRKQVQFKSAKWLIIFAVLGIPIGLFALIYLDDKIVKGVLGLFIVGYSVYSLISTNVFKLKTDNMWWLFVCGFFSGVFGGAYGLNGPPIVIYGDMRSWTPAHFRATLQAYFLPLSIIGLIGYWFHGILGAEVLNYFLISLPVVLLAIYMGNYLNRKINGKSFLKYVHIGLIAIALLLLANAFKIV